MVDYRFTLELTDYTVQKRITVIQGEVAARKFIINFSENGKPYQLNPYSIVVFRMTTPSGKDIFNNCVVNGNTVEYIPTSTSIAEEGLCKAWVEIYGNDSTEVLYSPGLELYIKENPYDDSVVEGSNEFTALQKALTDVSELMENLGGPEGVLARAEEQVDLAKVEVNNAKEQVSLATVYASEAGLKSQEAWQHAGEAAASKDAAANSALDSLNFSELSVTAKIEAEAAAAEAKHNLGEAQKILESVQQLEESAGISKEEAGIHAMAASSAKSDAKAYAEEAEASANHAYGYLDEARQNVEKMYTIIDEELPIYSAIYKNDSPDWVEHESGTTYPPNPGKDVHFKVDFKAGETYLLRFGLEHREGCFFDIGPCIVNPNTFDTTDVIGSYKESYSDGVYEYEFVATRSAAEDEELLLFVGVPFYKDEYGLDLVDETAVYGKVEIYHKDNLHNVVNEQNELIASISNDIESVLDGIIAFQESLIGGGTQ